MDNVVTDQSGLKTAGGKNVTELGNVTAGTLSTTGAVSTTSTLSAAGITNSGVIVNNATTATSGAGAVPITGAIHEITTTGTGDALTLVDGAEGQELFLVYVAEGAGGDTAVLTPTNLGNGSTVTFNALGDAAGLVFTNSAWYVKSLVGTAAVA